MSNIQQKLTFFPTINYKKHKLYKDLLSNSSLLEKSTSLKKYWPHFWNGLYEYKENVKRLFKNRKLYKNNQPSEDFVKFSEQGILLKHVDKKFIAELKDYLNKHIGYDMDKVKFEGQEDRHYITFSEADPNIKRLHDELLEKYGVFDIAKRYTKSKKILIMGFKLRIQQHDENFKQGLFEDHPDHNVSTNYMHVDSTMPKSQIKMIMYLGDVNEKSGPFCYVPSSHKLKDPLWRKVSRRVNHKIGLQQWGLEARKAFMHLPVFFQHKAEFGNDLVENQQIVSDLLEHEFPITSEHANFIVFDNSGFHRGGLVEEGRRISLQWQITADS